MSAISQKTANEAQVRERLDAWVAAIQAGHIEGIVAHHAPDIVLFDVPPPTQLHGAKAYRKAFEEFFGFLGDSAEFELRDVTITAGDDVAFCHAIIVIRGHGNEHEVRMTAGYRKVEGEWTVTHEHHSSPVDMP